MATITPAALFTGATAADIGDPNPYSGSFIPTIWSGKLIEKFYDATVLAAISNTDYEGEISNFGDKVIIREKPSITINPYTAGLTLSYEKPSAPITELNINQGKYWGTELDDVMEVQSDVDQLSMWADDASEQMKISIDTDVLAALEDTGHAANRGDAAGLISQDIDLGTTGTPLSVSKNNVSDIIVDAGTVLDEINVPESGRFMVIPAWMAGRIKKSDLKDASLTGDGSSILRNGRLGMIDRFTLYMSNLLPANGSGLNVYFGTTSALTFASQVTKVETLRLETTFGTVMRGLQVYGHETVKSEALGQMVVTKG